MKRTVLLVLGALTLVACSSDAEPAVSETTSTTSTVQEFTTDAPAPIDETPGAPSGLIVVQTSDGEIELAWDASRSSDVTGYEVTRVGGNTGTTEFTVTDTGFTDTGLDNGDIFTYSVAAVAPGGTSEQSAPVSARVGVDSNPPSLPGRPRVADRDASVALDWRPSNDISEIDKYIVSRTIDGTTELIETDVPMLDDDLPAGTVATYAVSAVDGVGNQTEQSRAITVLAGTSTDAVVIVVSDAADPTSTTSTARLYESLLGAGYAVTWFEDDVFDSNITRADDIVLLLGDVRGEGFDWNIFATDSTVIGLKSMFVQGAAITADPPKLDRLAQFDYSSDGTAPVEVPLTTTGRPKPVVYIPFDEQPEGLEVWATPVWSTELAVAGLVPKGALLANDKDAVGCRAFFPGNNESLNESTDEAWDILLTFVGDVAAAC